MSFQTVKRVRFADCDPAGIVFYPRYFEMLNSAVEDWFADGLGCDFKQLHLDHHIGTPTVKLDSMFSAPSFLWDELAFTLTPTKVGRSSCIIEFEVTCDDEKRLSGSFTLVCISLENHKSQPWPDDIKAKMVAA